MLNEIAAAATTAALNSEAVGTTTKTISEVGKNLIVTVDGIFSALSKAFPEVAGKGFTFYVQYVFAQGVADLFVGMSCFVSIFVLWSLSKKVFNVFFKNYLEILLISSLLAVIFGGVLFLVGNVYVSSAITEMIAPQGVVVKDIVHQIYQTKGKQND